MTASPSQKVLFMGLGASGKSTIRTVVFEGKPPEEAADYEATMHYARSTKTLVGTTFQIFDCGGQETFISNFVGVQAEFIFTDVKILIWVVDVADFDQVSASKFYYDQAIEKLMEYSPDSVVFCLFHKTDLLQPSVKEELLENMKHFFIPPEPVKIHYRGTTIFDSTAFKTFGEVIRVLFAESSKARSLEGAVHKFVEDTYELSGIALYSDEGLPIVEAGETAAMVLPANLWLTSCERLCAETSAQQVLKSTIETDKYFFVLQKMTNNFLLSGTAKKDIPIQFVTAKIEQLTETVNDLL